MEWSGCVSDWLGWLAGWAARWTKSMCRVYGVSSLASVCVSGVCLLSWSCLSRTWEEKNSATPFRRMNAIDPLAHMQRARARQARGTFRGAARLLG